MATVLEPAGLMIRAGHARAALAAGALVALGAVLLLALLIEPGSGVVDVQIPAGARSLVEAHRTLLASGEPWVVGRGIGRIPQMLACAMQAGSLVAAALGIWALAKRRKRIGWIAAAYIGLIQVAGPIPTTMQPEPPIAVSVATARRLLAIDASGASAASPWRRYMSAQLAYAERDRAGAMRLARGIDAEQLQSPIEARYRLQFLQSGPIAQTSVCFKLGCLSPGRQRAAQAMAAALLIAGAALAAGAAWLLILLTRRIGRIKRLRARPSRQVPA